MKIEIKDNPTFKCIGTLAKGSTFAYLDRFYMVSYGASSNFIRPANQTLVVHLSTGDAYFWDSGVLVVPVDLVARAE